MGVHDGHRIRVKEKFKKNGFEGLEDHEILEIVLFYTIPRTDTNPIAHRLINRFGSLFAVFEASVSELVEVDGISENTAIHINMFLPLMRCYKESRKTGIKGFKSLDECADYMSSRYFGRTDEAVFILCLGANFKNLGSELICNGTVNSASFEMRKIIETVIKKKATSVVITHNHPGGTALPSREDLDATIKVKNALKNINVVLLDHVIYCDDDFVSLALSQNFKSIFD